MGFIGSLIIAAIAGVLTGMIMKRDYPWYIDIILGLIGGAVGGWLSSIILGVDLTSGFNLTTLIVSIIGAVIVVAIYRLVTRRSIA